MMGLKMNEEEFKKTNINVACVIKVDLNTVKEFKDSLLKIVNTCGGDIIYHTVSPYKLKIIEEK
jgi:hypothetical protein